jgi:hypothetical protein
MNTLQSRLFLKNIENFLCKKMIPYKTYIWEDQLFLALYGSTIIQSRLFLKNIENFVWFPKQYLLGFFILAKQLANIPARGFLFHRNTLLLYSVSPYSQTESQTETQIHSLLVGWRNFFSSCAVMSVFGSGGKQFLVYILMYLEYHTVVVLCQCFWFWWEIVFGTYVLTIQLWCYVNFFGSGGK